MKCQPKGYILNSIENQPLSAKLALAELIDNSIQAEATFISVVFGKDEDGNTYLAFSDNGLGQLDMGVFARLGDHKPIGKRGGLSRYGVGLKDAALWLGGKESTFRVVSVCEGKKRSLEFRWMSMAENDWNIDDPSVAGAEPGDRGTKLTIVPVKRKLPEGAEWIKLKSELGYMYSPAIKRGIQISIKSSRRGSVPEILARWELPPLQPEHVDTRIVVKGKGARVYCGIVQEGHSNDRRGFTYVFKTRVIKTATSLGCGDHNPTRVAGFVELDDTWELTKNKDDVRDAEELYAAVELACADVLRQADSAGMRLQSKEFTGKVEGLLNAALSGKAKEGRGNGDSTGTNDPKNTGRKRRTAKKEQPGDSIRSRRLGVLRVAFDNFGEGVVRLGEFKEGTVILNLNNTSVSCAFGKNPLATAVQAASVIAINSCCGDGTQLRMRFAEESDIAERFNLIIGTLLSGPLLADGESVIHEHKHTVTMRAPVVNGKTAHAEGAA